MVKKQVKDPKESKDMVLKKGNCGKSTENDEAGTSILLRSSNRLKGKSKQAPEDRDIVKARVPQKGTTNKETLSNKKVEDLKKSKVVASKKGSRGKPKRDDSAEDDERTCSAGTNKGLKSLNRLKEKSDADINADETRKGKRKQTQEDRDLEINKSPQKKKTISIEILTKRKVEDPKKSEVLASKKGSNGKSKRHGNVEKDEEKTDYAGTSKVLRSSSRLKGKVDVDEKDKGMRKRDRRDRNAETDKSAQKVENVQSSKGMALTMISRGKSNRDDSDENDKERIHSAGTPKSLRSSSRLKGNAKANKGNIMPAPEARNGERDKSTKKIAEDPQNPKGLVLKRVSRGKPKRGDNAEKDKESSDSAETSKVIRASKRASGKAIADENDKGRRNHVPKNRNEENVESSQKKRNADNEKAKKKKLPKRKVIDVFKQKGGQEKVEKRKMPDRTCRSYSKTKK